MKNKLQLIESTIVVVARNHNPTILNPDFLKRNGIVNEDWGTEKVLCTDVISQIVFMNGFTVTAEPQKIAFSNYNPESDYSVKLGDIALSYIKQLPHVSYSAIGVNFRILVPFETATEANSYIIDNYITAGPARNAANGALSAHIKLVYNLRDSRLSLSLDPGSNQKPGDPEEKGVVIVHANFHRPLSSGHEQALVEMSRIIPAWKEDQKSMFSLLAEMGFGEETES